MIVIGIRAYTALPELAAAEPRLDEFVERGGTLVVQYQSGPFPAPLPVTMGRMPERVVDEQAPVKLLDPANPLLTWPNKITEADFDGWFEERGHGFPDSWDAGYTALTETADPGQDPQRGGLLVAHRGKGTYIYVAYALYRQFPELVPGAYRLLANLLSAGSGPRHALTSRHPLPRRPIQSRLRALVRRPRTSVVRQRRCDRNCERPSFPIPQPPCAAPCGRLARSQRTRVATAREESPMKWIGMLAAILILPVLPAAAAPQSTLPAGTILPIALDHGLNASKVHAGQTIRAEVMQDVPGTTIRRGAKVVGHVAEVHASPNGPATLKFTFDSVIEHGQTIPIKANLRALASRLEVDEAQVPEEMSSRGLNPENWTTQQIGGDQVYRGGGPVTDGLTDVGEPAPYGVLDDPRAQPRPAAEPLTTPSAHRPSGSSLPMRADSTGSPISASSTRDEPIRSGRLCSLPAMESSFFMAEPGCCCASRARSAPKIGTGVFDLS